MSQEDLLIRINANTKNVEKAFDDIKSKTEDLEGGLAKIAAISGVAFAALSAQVVVAVKEFAEADAASRELSATLQNQGIYTDKLKDSYKDFSDEVEKKTGIDGDQITKAQAVTQSLIGQIPITQELTAAIADLSVQQGISLPAAAEQLGKAIGQGTGALLKQGLSFSENSTRAERMAKTLEFVSVKAGGMAEEANKGVGALTGLVTAFGNTQEELGKRFAPAVEYAAKTLTEFLTPAKDSSGILVDIKAALIVGGLAVTGFITALAVGGQALIVFRAALLAMNISLTATRVALASIGIGLLISGLVLVAQHTTEIKNAWTQAWNYIVGFSNKVFDGLVTMQKGLMNLSRETVARGWEQIKGAHEAGAKAAGESILIEDKKTETAQIESKKALADKLTQVQLDQESARKEIAAAQLEAMRMEMEGASQEAIDLKKQEIETLKALESEKTGAMKELLTQRVEEIRQLEEEQRQTDIERQQQYDDQVASMQSTTDAKILAAGKSQNKKEIAEQRSRIMTQQDAEKKAYQDELNERTKAHNTFLMEQIKYGTAYATINQAMHSSEVQGFKSATGELVQLTQSKNSSLKAIGKAAAVASIIIKTAESAMSIFAGFSTIPIIGPALGLAGAAAAIAFGVEQIGNVTAAQSGGMVQGAGFGDKIPYLLEPGELVTPRQNFNEVISSVAQSRGMREGSEAESQGGSAMVEISLKDGLMDFIETKLIERKRIGISISR